MIVLVVTGRHLFKSYVCMRAYFGPSTDYAPFVVSINTLITISLMCRPREAGSRAHPLKIYKF